ncbi:AI-2E family transporter [Umezakia ovalisporum]|uniref:AI-2E family transporter n=2 Tax=Umezakia ovalisporum TaxID=75695 RepID=A0AA43KFL3_9CYAN|nr:AI-2E family transporter [Umezakia ovalisporum]MBI1241909.1 AI-2E family transporter [Nostoc sp. RI_552]MDH6064964.1 AI-2E family transporter [Umezakia ovalisporum FSS-62]MDH6067596.1 AI-2E family transporter [Umezakia ovalisporum APH033B]MDH6069473.1 AI-2E family transporter [Umezakia ovalisporum CobakiLakeA]MDH6075399.1 AI-2E family transporter [Umezakia ovalisporum CS-1034]
MTNKQRKSISLFDLWLIVGTFFVVVLLWQLRNLLVTLMISVVLAAAIAPLVNAAEKLRLPRWLGVILVYITLISGLIGLGLIIGPSVSEQIQRLASRLPIYLDNLLQAAENLALRLGITQIELVEQFFDLQSVTNWLFRSSQQLLVRSFGFTRGFIGGVVNLILALVMSAYMVAGSKNLIKGLVSLFPQPWEQRLAHQVIPISRRMGGYIQGRVLVSAILGFVITIGLRILGLSEFALALGVIAGFTNLIPFVGPVLGAIPALIVAIPQGDLTFVWVLLLFLMIQNLETYLLDPLLVGSSVRVHPLYQLLAVLGGTQVLGIVGAVIVPPWVAGIGVLVENLYLQPKLLNEQQSPIYKLAVSSDANQAITDSDDISPAVSKTSEK